MPGDVVRRLVRQPSNKSHNCDNTKEDHSPDAKQKDTKNVRVDGQRGFCRNIRVRCAVQIVGTNQVSSSCMSLNIFFEKNN